MSIFGKHWWSPLWMIENVFKINWGSAASAAVSVVGGMMSDKAAGDAADAQGEGAAQAIAEIKKIGERTRSDNEPYRDLGAASVDRLAYLLGYADKTGQSQAAKKYGKLVDTSSGIPQANMQLYASDPAYRKAYDEVAKIHYGAYGKNYIDTSDTSWIDQQIRQRLPEQEVTPLDTSDGKYGSLLNSFSLNDLNNDVVYNKALQFGLDEGLKSLDRRQLALGGYDSGAGVKAATRYANDYGETKAAGAQSRFMGDKQFTLNSLLGTTSVGQNAVALDANTGAQMAQSVGDAQMGAGNARAAGIVGGANAWGNAMSGVSNAYNTYQNNQQTDRILNGMGY